MRYGQGVTGGRSVVVVAVVAAELEVAVMPECTVCCCQLQRVRGCGLSTCCVLDAEACAGVFGFIDAAAGLHLRLQHSLLQHVGCCSLPVVRVCTWPAYSAVQLYNRSCVCALITRQPLRGCWRLLGLPNSP
jgi:hypothetical protein